jgi:hypothetical protein
MEIGPRNQIRPENIIKKEPSGTYIHRSAEDITVKKTTTNTNTNACPSKRRLARALRILLSCRLAGDESK